MKTAISVSDDLFHRVEARAAELKMNRSEFYSTAAVHYLRELDERSLTADIDEAVARSGGAGQREADDIAAFNRRHLAERGAAEEW